MDEGFNRLEELRRLKKQREAEAARLAAEEAERAKREAERVAMMATEEGRLEMERLAAEEAAAKVAAEEEERRKRQAEADAAAASARDRADADAKAKAEADAKAAAERAAAEKAAAEKAAAEAARLAAEREAAEAEAARLAALDAESAAKRAEALKQWEPAVAAVVAKAEGSHDWPPIAQEVVVQLRNGEPELLPHAAALLMLSDTGDGSLTVVSTSTEAPPCGQAGSSFPRGSAEPIAAAAFALLGGPNATAEVSPDGPLLAVLREANGHAYGVLVSGVAATVAPVPAEFLLMMAKAVGPAIECAWRSAKVDALADVAKIWLLDLCEDLAETVEYAAGLITTAGDGVSELPLSWTSGETVGVLAIKLKGGKKLGTYHQGMITVTSEIFKEAIVDIEALHIGEGGQSAGLEADRMLLPKKLLAYARKLLREMDVKLIAELKSYKSPPECVFRVMQSVMVVLEKKKLKALGEWNDVRSEIKDKIIDDATAIDATAKSKKEKWVDSKKGLKGLDAEDVVKKGSVPVQSFFKWLEIVFLCRKISKELRKQEKEEAEDEEEEEEEEEE